MIYTVVAIHDRAINAYGVPVFVAAPGQAIRSFQDEINRQAPENQMNRHPDDFDLWYIGMYDDQTGTFKQGEMKQLAIGKNLKIQTENPF